MNKIKTGILSGVLGSLLFPLGGWAATKTVDVCIYGGTSAGVIAAYTAKKDGKSVLIVEPGRHLGGMSSGGLGLTDIGNKYVVTGLARDFYRRVGQHYGKFEQWVFEPKVAESIFNQYVTDADIEVELEHYLTDVTVRAGEIRTIEVSPVGGGEPLTVEAEMFIDCSYEGDLMAEAGVSYTIGRESNSIYGETYNGVQQLDGHQVPDGIDPYVVPGDSTSGLLWGISPEPMMPRGTGDKKIQAYNYRITLTSDPDNRIPITRPADYDSTKYELLLRIKEKHPWRSLDDVFIWSRMPNNKTDINNRNGFSTDMIGMNWDYPEADYARRQEIIREHESYTKGLLYFIGTDKRIPEFIRKEMRRWGYPKDEYTDNGHWSHQLYIRESRRMVGDVVMTQHHCQGRAQVPDSVAMAAYTMDSHNCDRQVVNGMVKNEGNVEVGGFPPYPISYRAIVPKRGEISNLLVPVCMSASHIAYGSIRMEPVFMVLGQVAGLAASQAIDAHQAVQDVAVGRLVARLEADPLMDGTMLEILLDNADAAVVEMSDNWEPYNDSYRAYGPDFKVCDVRKSKPFFIKYTPKLAKEGTFDAYLYVPRIDDETSKMTVGVFNGKSKSEKVVKIKEVQVVGQTLGEWVSLGQYRLKPGSYFEITEKGADKIVAADAVLLIPAEK